MSDFEYFIGFIGLLLGLTVAEVAIKFADAIDSHKARPIGLLSPLLAVFVLFDITGFWLFAWSWRDLVTVQWSTVFAALSVTICYFLSAALIFPRTTDWPTLDDHYWARKRHVLAGILIANSILLGVQLIRLLPHWSDTLFFVWQGAYFVPLAALWFSRSRRFDIALLAFLIIYYVCFDFLPHSQWNQQIGLGGSPASTSPPPVTK